MGRVNMTDALVVDTETETWRCRGCDGELVDEELREWIEVLGREAVQYAHIEPDPASFESGENVGADD